MSDFYYDENPHDLVVPYNKFVSAIGLSRSMVDKYKKSGYLEVNSKGQVRLIASLGNIWNRKAYEDFNSPQDQLAIVRKEHEELKKSFTELRLAKAKGELYDAKTVEFVLTEMLANLRTQLLGLPSKLSPVLEGLGKEDINARLTEEIEDSLGQLSEYTPALFMNDTLEELNDEESD